MSRLPLEGIRVVDLTVVWAGPYTGRILADMGAEVIKIGSPESRGIGTAASEKSADGTGRRPYVGDAYGINYNPNKLGMTLDLSKPEGVQVFKRLVAVSDVVVENYSPRIMRGFGLGYEVIREVNPRIVMISMPAFGMTGPEREYMGYGIGIEQLSGYVALTGYSEDEPQKSGINYGDPVAGLHAAVALLAALYHRVETGEGQYIDLSQRESAVNLIGDLFMDYSMNRRVQRPQGNRDKSMAPHGCYRCKGEDEWVTIAVSGDKEWQNLCRVMGREDLADDSRYADALSRYANQGELDSVIEEWTSKHGHYEVMHLLQRAGVAAGAVLKVDELLDDPQVEARGDFQRVAYPDGVTYPIPITPWRFHGQAMGIRRPTADFGEHNEWVLSGILGMSKAEIESLLEKQVIAKDPIYRQR